ncbi:MAG: 3D domain-containing protein [Vulcanimicrobiaceae bacterium]|jgi:3D (Asp-Asp-Asp) domain-containing protein
MLSIGIVLPLASFPIVQTRVVALAERAHSAGIVHVSHWTQRIRVKTKPIVEHRLSILLAPTASKVVNDGTPTIREKVLAFRRADDNARIQVNVISSRIIQRGKPKVVISGILAYERYAQLAKRGFEGTMRLANAALEMFATAYTADCYGCSGMTKSGVRAGFGVVAVDPNVIPLGTHLYIKGYGPAIAGDTGGAIRGNRIDLGFDSSAAAFEFGAHPVHVYILK